MTTRTTCLILVFASALIAQRREVRSDPDPTSDWPRPELRAGLSDAQIAAAIADHARQLYDTKHFSGVVLAAKAGKVVVARAYGLADVAAKTPNTVDTRFNIGSLNKLFTKVAVAQLAEAGKLSLDDTVASRLPGVALTGADKITIRQLLEHRSGLGDIFGPRYQAAPPSRLRELADFLPLFADQPLAFEPGSSERYSNAGYVTLGLIIEKLTGETYRDYLAKHIFAPARMTSTGLPAVDDRVPGRATGYTLHGDDHELTERVPNTKTLPGRPSSAGGAYASAADLLRFYDALLADRLLSTKWTNWMLNDSFDNARRSPEIGVAGGAPGLNAAIEISGGWTVIAMANFDPPSAGAVARGAMDIIRGHRQAEGPDGRVRRGPPLAPTKTELEHDVAVPTTMSGHLITVAAKINGQGPFRFAVDSGAGGMMRITSALQNKLQLAEIGQAMTGDPSGKNMTTRPVVRAEHVEIGGARFTGVDAVVGDPLGGDELGGVIGLRLFATLTATLDYPKQELRLGRQPLDAHGAHVVAYSTERGIPVIDLEVAGVAMKVDVDTGSPAVLSMPSAFAAKLAFTGAPKVVGKGRTAANEFEIRAAELRGELRVAGFAQAAPRVDIVDAFPVANLGSQFLRQYAVTFDLANQRMALAK
jgi:CubicO group peptidase (beta-lactamase class C family)/predicted aspartyl protease